MKRLAFLFLVFPVALHFFFASSLSACGGCYEKARDIQVAGPACLAVVPSEQAGCGRADLLVDNGCTKPFGYGRQDDAGHSQEAVPVGARRYKIDTYGSTREGQRDVLRGTIGSESVVISWITE